MAYSPEWERLSDAAARVMTAAGVSKEQAQTDICQAIADGKVKIRCQLKRHKTNKMTSKTVLEGNAFEIPTRIKPDDLDWEGSRPVNPWRIRRGSYAIPGDWDLEWVELSGTHVTKVLCVAGRPSEAAQPTRKTGARSRSRPKLESAHRAIEKLYPDGVPGQADVPNAILCRRVGKWLQNEGLLDVSDETILRAASRRRK
jgi:hypothetical protein